LRIHRLAGQPCQFYSLLNERTAVHWYLPNCARNLAVAGFGRIFVKWLDFGAEIWHNPSCHSHVIL